MLILSLISFYNHAQTIHLSGYNGNSMDFCPNGSSEITLFARDIFNNKIAGTYTVNFFVDGNPLPFHGISLRFNPNDDPSTFNPPPYFNMTTTSSNKDLHFDIVHYDAGLDQWLVGFKIQSNNIRMQIGFKENFLGGFGWTYRNFNLKSRAIDPGKAVIIGEDNVFFCSPNEIKTVTLPDIPESTNNAQFCFWHHQWVWELPVGWKVTSVGGNMATATNVYQGSKTVQIKAPAILSNATLNVRSENAWPYPVNTQTQIITGVASAPEEISYNFMLEFPEEICYPTAFGNLGDFIASAPLSGANSVAYYEWQSDAGIVQTPTSTYPSTSVQFNNPGYRFIRVRSVNFCGVPSAWRTEYFTLTYNINGCSGGGLGGFSIISSPNPAADEINIEVTDEESKSNSLNSQDKKYYRYLIFNMNQDLIYDKQSKSPRHHINTRSLKSGRYILRVITPDGSKTQHLIIDRDKKD